LEERSPNVTLFNVRASPAEALLQGEGGLKVRPEVFDYPKA